MPRATSPTFQHEQFGRVSGCIRCAKALGSKAGTERSRSNRLLMSRLCWFGPRSRETALRLLVAKSFSRSENNFPPMAVVGPQKTKKEKKKERKQKKNC